MEMEASEEMLMEMEAAEGMSWEALFHRRVVMANAHCDTVHGLLHGLLVAFAEQETRDMGSSGMEEARRTLETASAELGLAAVNMGAALHLALRCGRRAVDTDPRAPLSPSASSDDLADPDARRALDLLREAAKIIHLVHDLVECARGHLGAAELFLLALGEKDGGRHREVAPWAHIPSIAEQIDAALHLAEGFSQAIDLVGLTAAARDAAFGVGDD